MKTLLWISAITLWLMAGLALVAWLWDVWLDVRKVLDFALAWNRALKASGKSIWTRKNRAFLWDLFWDFRDGVDFSCTFDDGTRWSSHEAHQ